MTPLKRVVLCDPDCIGIENLGTQGWSATNVGSPKVEVAKWQFDMCDLKYVVPIQKKFGNTIADVWADVDVMFVCPDNITARSEVYRMMQQWAAGTGAQSKKGTLPCILIDGRAARYIAHVWALDITDQESAIEYEGRGLFSEAAALQAPCAERMTIYIAHICAALMLHQFAVWTRGEKMELETLFDVGLGTCITQ